MIKTMFLLLLLTAGIKGETLSTPEHPTPLQEASFQQHLQRNVHLKYLLYVPDDYGESQKKWPLILYLHGGKGRGNDLQNLLWYPVPKMLKNGEQKIPFIVVMPQCTEGEMWTDTEALMALLDEINASYLVDSKRIYLTGYSMGGNGVWYLAYKHPQRFAAIAPMSGASNVWWTSRLKVIPSWVFHGEKDDLVPARESEEMVASLRAKGADVRFSLNPERGHSPPTVEEHLELFQWFLTHK